MKMMLQNTRVFCEQWYGPFRNGDQLGGCAIRDSAFASTAALKASEVVGTWQGPRALANFDGYGLENDKQNFFKELLDNSEQNSVRDESGLILLPKQLWCSHQNAPSQNDLWTCNHIKMHLLKHSIAEGYLSII